MNFYALKYELQQRGFEYIADARLGQYINDARQALDNLHLWPYREAFTQGIAPLVVLDLGTVEAVLNQDAHQQLRPGDFRQLLDDYGDLTATGTPELFYVAWPDGYPVVATYPESTTTTIAVQYYKTTPQLVDALDEPLTPVDYHMLIVDMAAQRAYMNTDNFAAAQALQPFIEQALGAMIDTLLGGQQVAGPFQQQATFDASVDW